jgi:hypothetical protein
VRRLPTLPIPSPTKKILRPSPPTAVASIIPKQLGSTKNGEVTLSQESYPTLTSVLLTLQVATSGYVITSQASNDCKVLPVRLKKKAELGWHNMVAKV